VRIEWGTRTRSLNLGTYPGRRCETCRGDRPFSLWLRYTCDYIFDPALSKVLERKYVAVCESCGEGALLDTKTMDAAFSRDPIPWPDRLGFVIGGGAIALVGLLIFVASRLR
jgi:hypothetical protein